MTRPTSERKYKPGSRSPKGRISEGREAWVRFLGAELILYTGDGDESAALAEDQLSETLRFHLYVGGQKKWGFNLTTLTEEELDAFQNFMQYIFDRARPLVQQRDKEAQEALANGDDSYARIYRQVPQFVVRPRPEREHDSGLRERPDGVPAVVSDSTTESGDVRPDGDRMAELLPQDGGTQDNGSPVDQSEGMGEVGEVGS